MPTVYVLFWLDTEDVLVPATHEAPLRIAQLFNQRGLRATFKLTGEKLRALEQRGRTDVLDALRLHDIGYHTDHHSTHPTPAEYLREMDWDEGVAEFIRREGQGVKDILRVFGRSPVCYGQPGGSWAPQAYGALRQWGIPAYVSANSYASMGGVPFYYGGVLTVSRMQPNQMTIGFDIDKSETLQGLKQAFDDRYAALQRLGGGVISIGSHPLQWILDGEFSDGLNFAGGRNIPPSARRQPPLKPRERIEDGFNHLGDLLDFIMQRENALIVGTSELAHHYAAPTVDAQLELTDLLLVLAPLAEEVNFQKTHLGYLSAAELFYLFCTALAEYARTGKPPQTVQSRPVLGPVRPAQTTLRMPALSIHEFLEAASAALDYAHYYYRIPSEIHAGAGVIAPEDFLATGVGLLQSLAVNKKPMQIKPIKARVRCADYVSEQFAQAAWRWRIFPDSFTAPKLLDLAKLQAWTIKPA